MRNPRKPVAALLLLAYLSAYVVLIGSFSGPLSLLPGWVQLAFYVIAGCIWIVPLRPLLRWMNAAEPPAGD